jgi:cytochrome P450
LAPHDSASGGTSSTAATLNTFILAMTCYPEVQKRAQAELDSFLLKKEQKLPSHADLEHLPFCMALVYEVLRCAEVNFMLV